MAFATRPYGRGSQDGQGQGPTLEGVLIHFEVERFVPGKARQMVCCILHEDRNPSCSVNLERGLWNCHSCGEGGDAWTMIMKKEGLDYLGARRYSTDAGLSAEGAGGRDSSVRGGDHLRGGWLADRKGDRQGGSGWRPSWLRG